MPVRSDFSITRSSGLSLILGCGLSNCLFQITEEVGLAVFLVHFIQQALRLFPLANVVHAVLWIGTNGANGSLVGHQPNDGADQAFTCFSSC